MTLDSVQPLYSARHEDWTTMRDLYKGERHVKSKGEIYLPATRGMVIDGMKSETAIGRINYEAYKMRAVFPDYLKDAVEAYIGLLHQKPPTIELPAIMEPLRDKATVHGENLNLLLRRINEEQLVTGRCGLLLDLPVTPNPTNPIPYIELYVTEAIRNWDDGEIDEGVTALNMVVLDETGYKRTGFEWNIVGKYRVLQLGQLDVPDGEERQLQYQVGVFSNEGGGVPTFVESDMNAPVLRGSALEEIPFVFVNSKDIVPTPDEPPLMGLGLLSLAIYRGEADYRQNLFMQGQDTLVLIGDRKRSAGEEIGEDSVRTGAGTYIEMDAAPGASAQYIGVTATGLSEQRTALENDRQRAEAKAGQLIDAKSGKVESGEALKTRLGAQTATLNQIAQTGAAALEQMLKMAAKWMGADPEAVTVTPNLEFADFDMTGENLVKLMTARAMGAPLSKGSIHALMVDQGLTKLDYETEMDTIGEEDAQDAPLPGTVAGGNPDDPLDPANKLDTKEKEEEEDDNA